LRVAGRNYGLQVVVLAVIAIVLVITTPSFQGEPAVYASLERLTLVGITAAGLAVTMIAGELDMSVGSMAVLSGVIAIQLGDLGLVPSILIATAVGIALGALQGIVIARLGINSLVFTVGTLILFRGVAWLVAGGGPVTLHNFRATDPLLARFGVLSPTSIVAIVVIAGIGVFLAWTRWGREIYAIGGARVEATAAGVPVRRSLVIAFMFSGGTAALAGALSSMKGASATPDSFGSLLLTAVAACLIGGISLYGGRGDVVNIVLGVLILSVLSAGMAAQGAQSYVTELFTGALLLVVITIDFILARVYRRRRLLAVRSHLVMEAAQ
jgi:ribose/xylose/arabinose/galactoside ABC-type transport system permease subunit